MDIKIEVLTEVDVEVIATWQYEDETKVYNLPNIDEMKNKGYSMMDENLRHKEYYAFYCDEKLIGFGRLKFKENAYWIGIGLNPDLLSKGYGTSCMRLLTKKYLSLDYEEPLKLIVRSFNKRAIRCYEKSGFKTFETKTLTTMNGTDEFVLMGLELTKVYFVRHAHSTYTPDELGRPLSAKGYLDASKLKDVFENIHIDYMFSSPYKRAVETIRPIKDLPIYTHRDLRERLLSKVPVEDFNEAMDKIWSDSSFHFEGGESNHMAANRVKCVMDQLLEYGGKNIVIGTHGNIMTLALYNYDSSIGYDFWKELNMPDVYEAVFVGKELRRLKCLLK